MFRLLKPVKYVNRRCSEITDIRDVFDDLTRFNLDQYFSNTENNPEIRIIDTTNTLQSSESYFKLKNLVVRDQKIYPSVEYPNENRGYTVFDIWDYETILQYRVLNIGNNKSIFRLVLLVINENGWQTVNGTVKSW